VIDEVSRAFVALLASASELGSTTVESGTLGADAERLDDTVVVCLHGIEQLTGRWTLPPRVGGAVATRPEPPGLRMRYLVTYEGDDHLLAQARLAAVAAAVDATPMLTGDQLAPELRERVDSLTITGFDLELDEQRELWRALGRPLQLSLAFAVDASPAT
jgi:hypothetical protein